MCLYLLYEYILRFDCYTICSKALKDGSVDFEPEIAMAQADEGLVTKFVS